MHLKSTALLEKVWNLEISISHENLKNEENSKIKNMFKIVKEIVQLSRYVKSLIQNQVLNQIAKRKKRLVFFLWFKL